MSRLSWDHNAYYHRLLLRQLPEHCERVLDVGCGTGAFAVELAGRARQVDAVDSSPVMVEAARARVPAGVDVSRVDVVHDPLPHTGYDAITAVSVLHHLPLRPALSRLADGLRPGGVLAAISLPEPDYPRDLWREASAVAAHRVLGGTYAIARTLTRRRWYATDPADAAMPVAAPALTMRQVRDEVIQVLPGARVDRLRFWRYLLTWRKPGP